MLNIFYGCRGLTSVIIPNSVTSIGSNAFSDCSGLISIIIPNSVTYIGSYAFEGCSGLTSITIPSSVTSIGNYAFEGCSGLTSITIGSNISKIYSTAFASCPELNDVTCLSENVPITESDVFKDSYIEYATLHVPANSVNAYKAAEPWKNFKSIEAIEGTATNGKCATPEITYANGKLSFTSATEGVEFLYEITSMDSKKGNDSQVQLSTTYNVSVYATKAGYEDSDIATRQINVGTSSAPKGDVNGDGLVTVTDAVQVIDIVLNK